MLDDKTRAQLQEKYGTIAEADAPDGTTVAIRKPDAPEYRAYIAKLAKDSGNKEAAIRDIVRESAVYPQTADGKPDGTAIDSTFDRFPGLPLAFGGAITEMTGTDIEVKIRKN